MASKASCSSTRPLLELFQRTRRRPRCAKSNQLPRSKPPALLRNVSTATPQHSEMDVENEPRPRWSYTPPAMVAPVRSRLPRREEPWKVNDDPKKLDSVYLRFLGPEGDKLLTDETKWLAVTHKSFDHGRRGFNDRLSYLGKRIVELQMTLALLGSATRDSFKVPEDPHGRQPFQHPATEGIEVLGGGARAHLLHHMQISALAQRSGLGDVVRWNPKNPDRLQASGFEMVIAQAVFAIVGAIALERGGGEANRIVRKQIIGPLGVRAKMGEGSTISDYN